MAVEGFHGLREIPDFSNRLIKLLLLEIVSVFIISNPIVYETELVLFRRESECSFEVLGKFLLHLVFCHHSLFFSPPNAGFALRKFREN